MPVVKNPTILDSTTLFGGSGIYAGTSLHTPYGWAKMIHIRITNQATPLTIPATAQVEVSDDDITYYSFKDPIIGFIGASDVKSIAFIVKVPAIYLRVLWVAGDQNVDILSEVSEVIEKEPSVRQLTTKNQITLSSTSETTLLSANANFFLDITDLTIINTSVSDTATVDFRDSTSGTIRLSINLNPNSSEIINFSSLLKQGTINNNWTAQSSIAVSNIIITALAQLNT